jgi:hypothetical protein
MRFVIDNRTKYQTRDLRALVVRAYKVATECAGPGRTATFEARNPKIRVRFARSNWRGEQGSTGHGYYHLGRSHVGLGDSVNPRIAAKVIAHEFGHNLGLRHPDMAGGPLMNMDSPKFDFATKLPLREVAPKAKPSTREKRAREHLRVIQRLRAWESKRKRAETAIRKLKAKERRLSALTEV